MYTNFSHWGPQLKLATISIASKDVKFETKNQIDKNLNCYCHISFFNLCLDQKISLLSKTFLAFCKWNWNPEITHHKSRRNSASSLFVLKFSLSFAACQRSNTYLFILTICWDCSYFFLLSFFFSFFSWSVLRLRGSLSMFVLVPVLVTHARVSDLHINLHIKLDVYVYFGYGNELKQFSAEKWPISTDFFLNSKLYRSLGQIIAFHIFL